MIHKMMYARFEAAPGQWESLSATSWTVPEGVYSVCVVVVGCALQRGGTKLLTALNGDTRTGDGGGNGGNPGSAEPGYVAGGGNGGYTGNGGKGGDISTGEGNPEFGVAGISGAGGGGGGGGGGGRSWNYGGYPSGQPATGGMGGGVGLNGIGSNGGGGTAGQGGDGYATSGTNAGHGSALAGATIVPATNQQKGSNLSWSNDIPVTPGEVLTINRTPSIGGLATLSSGIRIIWGGGRSYPSNAGSV